MGEASGSFVIAGSGPTIEYLDVASGDSVDAEGHERNSFCGCFYITDTRAPGNVTAASLVEADGTTHALSLDQRGVYTVAAGTKAQSLDVSKLGPEGYSLVVTDASGKATTMATPPIRPLAMVEPISPANNSVISDLKPTFSWNSEHQEYANLDVWGKSGDPLWSLKGGTELQATYDSDGTACEDSLQPGHSYVWQLEGYGTSDFGNWRNLISSSRDTASDLYRIRRPSPDAGTEGKVGLWAGRG